MSVDEKALTYRGDIQAIASFGTTMAWVTRHPQQLPTAIYRLDAESMELHVADWPTSGTSVLAGDKGFFAAGDDHKLYYLTAKGKKPKEIADLPAQATKLALLSQTRLAAICDTQLLILDRAKGDVLQTLNLSNRATALAADPTGQWIVVGQSDGTITVFECEDKEQFLVSESEKLHPAAITSLLFEPEELRFFSACAGQKLFLTHARGKLESEDRGRSSCHKDRVSAMLLAGSDRFITGSRDKSCKSWARAGATQPATLGDGVGVVIDIALVLIHGRTHLAIASKDNSVRLFLLETDGRFGAPALRILDAYARADKQLSHNTTQNRGEGLTALADLDDNRSTEMLANHIQGESDPALRLRGTKLLCESTCPLAAKLLEPLLGNDDAAVRAAALDGLCEKSSPDNLEPMRLALNANQANIGTSAVARLAKLADKDENASRLMVESISHSLSEIRVAAQLNLETVLDSKSPDANLTALTSTQADSRVLALVRLFQRKMLDRPRVQAAIRRSGEDSDADVRRHAFLIALLSHEKLASAIRFLDEDLHRGLHSLESIGKGKFKAKTPKAKKASTDLDPDDLTPLLTAMASRATDTALLGARCLALLGDARSLGMLLQLSRDNDANVRGEVCRALAALGDTRATDRLETMLDDSASTVRDAAFTAYHKLTDDDPLGASESGLTSVHEDVRRRAMSVLIAWMRKSAKNKKDTGARELLIRALNDAVDSVRSEAFKASLNMQIDGGGGSTLRFVLHSVHADIRREVLTEVIAEEKQDWAWELLLELFSDPNVGIRNEAFEHAIGKTKARDIAPMQMGLQSSFADVRQKAVHYLIKLHTPESQSILVTAVDDDDKGVRQAALNAIVDSGAADLLKKAMSSKHDDVRLLAACTLAANLGDQDSRDVLLSYVTAEEPVFDNEKEHWKESTLKALDGLRHLGDSSIADSIQPLLKSMDLNIRVAATFAFAHFLDASGGQQLQAKIQDADEAVRAHAALGLAITGDTAAMPIVLDALSSNAMQFGAAVVYGDVAEMRLIGLLDHSADWIRNGALFTLFSRDLLSHDGTPRRLVACLSAESARIRLHAARAVEAFCDRDAFQALLVNLVNDRGDSEDWTVSEDDVMSLANVLVFGSSPIQDRAILSSVRTLDEHKQEAWNQSWGVFRSRFASEIDTAKAAAGELPDVSVDADELTQVAFGTYVGLVRDQGGNRTSFGSSFIAIRQTAIRRLIEITASDPIGQASVRPVLIQALGDPNQAVRFQAFDSLPAVGVSDDARALAAIESGHIDLAVKGMELLTGEADLDTAREVLKDVILSRNDRLASEAAKLLAEKTDTIESAEVSLQSPFEPLRDEAVRWLVSDYDESKKAKDLLYASLHSKYLRVRHAAAVGLADKKDAKAFDALVALLQRDDDLVAYSRSMLDDAFKKLGDERATDAALDRVENDPEETARVDEMFALVGEFRNPMDSDRIAGMMQTKRWRDPAASTLLRISGYDQWIEDPQDEREDKSWIERQHPRHDGVFAKLINRHMELDSPTRSLMHLIPDARWSPSDAVNDGLSRLSVHADESLRHAVLEAIGWRVKHRAAPPEPLINALQSRDPHDKFLAAEGLARAGHNDGFTVLMSAVELLSDLEMRSRAVLALGELADKRALDLLLRLASDDQHALQNSSARAIGHLSNTDQADEIFNALKRLVTNQCSATEYAITGLRHFDTADGWQLLRDHVTQRALTFPHAMEQLSYNDDPATRDLYLDLLKTESGSADYLSSARRLFGMDSLEPDFALLNAQNGYEFYLEPEYQCVQRVCDRGDAVRILETLPNCEEDVIALLSASLLKRDPLPVEPAIKALESSKPETVRVAAHIVGIDGDEASGKAIAKSLQATLTRWNEAYAYWLDHGEWREQYDQAVSQLVWAASRTKAAKSGLLEITQSHLDEPQFSPIREAALMALGDFDLTKTDLGKLKKLIDADNATIRSKAAALVIVNDADQLNAIRESVLSDRAVFQSVVRAGADVAPLLDEGIGQPHRQAIVLQHVVGSENIESLSHTAANNSLTDTVRLGAIEGLGQIGNEGSLKQLASIGANEDVDEELRKAAWRSYRRSKRRMK